MKAGKYIAKVENCGVVPDKKDRTPQPFIQFKTETDETITWYGSLKNEKATDYAVKAAVTCGFLGSDWDQFNKLMMAPGQKVQIEVEENDYEGKTYPRVKWINALRSFETMSADEIKTKVSSAAKFAQIKSAAPKTEEVPF